MGESEKDRLQTFVAFLQKHGVNVLGVSRGDCNYRFKIDGDYTKLPPHTRACMGTFEEKDGFYAYVRIKQLTKAITIPKTGGKWTSKFEEIDGKLVESKIAKMRIPGISFNGQFRLEHMEASGGAGVVDYDSKASDYARRKRS